MVKVKAVVTGPIPGVVGPCVFSAVISIEAISGTVAPAKAGLAAITALTAADRPDAVMALAVTITVVNVMEEEAESM